MGFRHWLKKLFGRRTKPSLSLADQARYYRDHPPRCIVGFVPKPAELPGFTFDGHASPPSFQAPGTLVIEGAQHLNAVFLLACTCGHEQHYVLGYHWRVPDDGPLLFLSPLALRCAACGKETPLLDTDRHGYDAEQGGIVATARAEGERGEYRCHRCGAQPLTVCVRFEYSDDLLDERWLSHEEFRDRQQDLFTWFSLVGKCPGCSYLLSVTDFECA